MDRAILPLGKIISDSFTMPFKSGVWFFLIPALLSLISAGTNLLLAASLNFVFAMATSSAIGIFTSIFVISAALNLSAGKAPSRQAAMANLGARFFTLFAFQVVIAGALLLFIYGLLQVLFPAPSPELQTLGKVFWENLSLQPGSAEEQEILQRELVLAMSTISETDLVSLISLSSLISGFIFLVALAFIAFFTPFNAIVVAEGLGIGAVRRSIELSAGYGLKIIGIIFVFALLLIPIGFFISIFGGLLSIGLGPTAGVLVFAALFAPITSLTAIMITHIYVYLREIKDGTSIP